jgi:hypothetical protein
MPPAHQANFRRLECHIPYELNIQFFRLGLPRLRFMLRPDFRSTHFRSILLLVFVLCRISISELLKWAFLAGHWTFASEIGPRRKMTGQKGRSSRMGLPPSGMIALWAATASERTGQMNISDPGDFDGFITPEGELVPLTDVDRIYALVSRGTDQCQAIMDRLWDLGRECAESGYHDAAYGYFLKLLPLANEDQERAHCLLSMGQAREAAGDFESAKEIYLQAFSLPQALNQVWYFLNNNLGFCLNGAGDYQLAARHCRAAIKIDRKRHNAHKNLGVSLYGMKKYKAAARCLVRATLLCPRDARALTLLEGLVASHTEVLEEDPRLLDLLMECHKAVRSASVPTRPQ